jgi:methylated-DNA-protein-cysteine methyltransferase related protein
MRKTETFAMRVARLALSIPAGRVSTYGRISRAAGGGAMAAQSVTAILGKAWDAGEHGIPFHRIVYADGRIWMNARNRKERLALYKKEGIELDQNGRIKNFADTLFEFS